VIVENMNSPHKIEPRLGLVSFGGASLLDAPSVYAFFFCATGLRGFCRGALGDLTQSQPNTPREPALRYDGAGGLFFSVNDEFDEVEALRLNRLIKFIVNVSARGRKGRPLCPVL
jgi:hypothetical protein